ncbi:MAG: hypothetical protein ACREQM_02980 [Candidatus Dormibacteraceae bacterium]
MIKRFLLGVAVGAGAVWLLDPQHGGARRRRAGRLMRTAAPVARRAGRTLLAGSGRGDAREGGDPGGGNS